MRVSRLQIKTHPGIGDLGVDFRDASGKAAKIIVIAGENGTGKTAILKVIYALLTGNHPEFGPSARFSALIERDLIRPQNGYPRFPEAIISEAQFAEMTGFNVNEITFTDGLALQVSSPIVLPERLQIPDSVQNIAKTHTPCFFSTSEITFRVPAVQQMRAYDDNAGRAPPLQTNENLGAEIISLLVALKAADDGELSRWVAKNPGQVPPESVCQPRIKRFREAFSYVMPHKRFVGVEQKNDYYHPIFEEDGRETTLSELSSGEKQIVFKGAFLLQHLHRLPGAVILIDEPELGLHPSWQSKIVEYYDKIIGDNPDSPGQLIIATHSPFVVHGSPTAKHIILKRNRLTRCVEVDPSASYPGVTTGDLAIAAFDLAETSFGRQGNKLAIVTEGPTDAKILNIAWQKLRPGSRPPFDTLPARGAASIPSLLGTAEGVLGPLADAAAPLGIDRFIGLFDFDHEGFPYWNGLAPSKRSDDECLDVAQCSRRRRKGCLIWSALLPVPQHRAKYAGHNLGFRSGLAIELLFPDAQVLSMLTEINTAGSDNTILVANDNQKKIIAEACVDFPLSAFDAFRPIFDLVDHVLAYSVSDSNG